jgi:hypothetical protein
MYPVGSELLYNGLNDIDTSDASNLDIVSTATGLLDCFEEWTRALLINDRSREKHLTIENDEKERFHHLVTEVLAASIFHSIFLMIIKLFRDFDVSFERVREAFVGLGRPDLEDSLYMASTMSKRFQENYDAIWTSWNAILETHDLLQKARVIFCHTKEMLTQKAVEICAELFENVLSTADITESLSEVPEEPQIVGDFRDHENEY